MIRIGAKKAVFFPLTTDESPEMAADGVAKAVYSNPMWLPKLQKFTFKPKVQTEDVDADDMLDETITVASGAEGEVQRNEFSPEECAFLLGEQKLDGITVSTTHDTAPYGAFGAMCEMSGGSYLYQLLLKTKFSVSDFTAETKGSEKLTTQPDTLTFRSITRAADGAWRFYVKSNDPDYWKTFFTKKNVQKLADSASTVYGNPCDVYFVDTLPDKGEVGTVYVAANISYYWNGTEFVKNGEAATE